MNRSYKSFLSAFVPMLLLMLPSLFNCTPAKRKMPEPGREEIKYQPGYGDAYLFDVNIYREGRKNSVRLDLYCVNDFVSIYARGYLGKGVMKGLLYYDSAVIYFPSQNEYYSGPINDLLDNNCLSEVNIGYIINNFFRHLPTEISPDTTYSAAYINDNIYLKEFSVVWGKCLDSLFLEYDLNDGRYLLDNIEYTNNNNTFRLSADRRKYKLNIRISRQKMELQIPSTAVEIIP